MLRRLERSPEGLPGAGSFEGFFRSHYAAIVQIASSILQDRHLAEDVAQDVMISAQQRWVELADDSHAKAWVRTAAVHLALNAVRDNRRRARRHGRTEATAASTPEDVTLERESSSEIRAALAKLPRRSATILVLRHSGLSYAEIADATGVKVGNVGTLLRRAEAALRREVEHEARS